MSTILVKDVIKVHRKELLDTDNPFLPRRGKRDKKRGRKPVA
jgi:hypothetical protein